VSGSQDKTLQVWDVASHTPLGAQIEIPFGIVGAPIGSLAFNDDAVLASTEERTVLWDPVLVATRFDQLRASVCRRVARSLTKAEWEDAIPDEPYRESCPGS
jgi:hypothetical protein